MTHLSGAHGVSAAVAHCNASSFPRSLLHTECWGLSACPADQMGRPITDAAGCLSACCAKESCSLWNFKSSESPPCWIWTKPEAPATCRTIQGWAGGGGRGTPPAPPPAPPGGPQSIVLPAMPPRPTPLAHIGVNTTNPDGVVLSVDSRSLLQDDRRIYTITGEIHLSRLPASAWREQLMRMKSGGLNWVSVYLFWIYYEESEGHFTFDGRRNVRGFLRLAGELGLRVLLRIGPWCHGEVRNGGHPDWALTACGKVRTTDPDYLRCVSGWYTALAEQLRGLYWKDGGPVVAVQVDNETRDWRYLLALRSLALDKGIWPAFFVKTGWPAPSAGFPTDYPMLPLFGGYADLFWTNSMGPGASPQSYAFALEPGGRVVPAGYPWLDVEIGGGMAAAYNHRVHMDPSDMPAMHLVDVGSGVNGLGYYMYQCVPHAAIEGLTFAPQSAEIRSFESRL